MTQETIKPSQRAKDAAGELRDELRLFLTSAERSTILQAFARFERSILSEHDRRVKELEAENARLREATRLLDELRGNFLRALISTEKE